jgi:SAM-dependent methyltransferase
MSLWGQVLLFAALVLVVIELFRSWNRGPGASPFREGFTQSEEFVSKKGPDIYDPFYVDIYDYLVYNTLKNEYEVGQIINRTQPSSQSLILDVGAGTGHHVASFASRGYDITGVDLSHDMVKKAQENYPNYNFMQGDALQSQLFQPMAFTDILCLYFTVYYFPNKNLFFDNCMQWLRPGGHLFLHLVDRSMFDPILPAGNPLLYISPQRYAKERITHTEVIFHDMKYTSDFALDEGRNLATFREKFVFQDDAGKVRQNELTLYMEPEQQILSMAQEAGFVVAGKIDLLKCQYEYQYVYILEKPN